MRETGVIALQFHKAKMSWNVLPTRQVGPALVNDQQTPHPQKEPFWFLVEIVEKRAEKPLECPETYYRLGR